MVIMQDAWFRFQISTASPWVSVWLSAHAANQTFLNSRSVIVEINSQRKQHWLRNAKEWHAMLPCETSTKIRSRLLCANWKCLEPWEQRKRKRSSHGRWRADWIKVSCHLFFIEFCRCKMVSTSPVLRVMIHLAKEGAAWAHFSVGESGGMATGG